MGQVRQLGTTAQISGHCSLWAAIAAFLLLLPGKAIGQNIVFDGTLGTPGSLQAQPVPGNLGLRRYTIPQDRGKDIGSNLFHSFSQFNLTATEEASFASSINIQNILVRVTGGALSTIDGRILTRSQGIINGQIRDVNVNLFFINPNGIIFGPNARLDGISGSFVATTLDAIVFPNGRFSAVNPGDRTSLLTLVGDPSGFLASQRQPGDIQITRRNQQVSGTDLGIQGLSVPQGRSMIFLGGNVTLNDSDITISRPNSLGRRIELGGVAGAGEIGLARNGSFFSLVFPDAVSKADITVTRSKINLAASQDGSLAFNARNLNLTDSNLVLVNGTGGGITVNAQNLTMANSDLGLKVQGGSNLVTPEGGAVRLQIADALTVTNNSIISSEVGEGGTAKGGDVDIQTQRFTVQNSQVRSDTFGIGNAGNLTIDASQLVDLSGDYLRDGDPNPGGLFAQVNVMAIGQGGNLTIATPFLSVREGSKVQAATFGKGNAGNVFIQAQDVQVIDTPEIANQFPTAINAGATLTLDPVIDAQGNLQGNGGNLTIATDRLLLRGGEITVDNFGVGSAGNLFITASDSVQLSDRSKLSAETRSGQGGDINLTVGSLLLLRTNSQISTTAGTAQAGGDGGNIRINAKFILAVPSENSDITANAFTGKGGNIDITAQNIFGIQPRPFLTPLSDITASSQFGLNGTITINTLGIDPNRGLVALPTGLTDPSQQIVQDCVPKIGKTASSFVITGRGGIPLSPDEPLESLPVMARWVSLPEEIIHKENNAPINQDDHEVSPATIHNPQSTISNPLVEATGWIVHPNGQVELVAEIPRPQPNDESHLNPYTQATHGWLVPLVCQGVQ